MSTRHTLSPAALQRVRSSLSLALACACLAGCVPVTRMAGLAATPRPTATLTPAPSALVIPSATATPTPEPTRLRLRTSTPGPTHTPTMTRTLYRPWLTLEALPTYTPSPTRTPRPLPADAEVCDRVLLPEDVPDSLNPLRRERFTASQAAARYNDPAATRAEFRRQGRRESCYASYAADPTARNMFIGLYSVYSEVSAYGSAAGAARAIQHYAGLYQVAACEPVPDEELFGFPEGVVAFRCAYSSSDEASGWDTIEYAFLVQRGRFVACVEVDGVGMTIYRAAEVLQYVEIAAERISE
ncbi:MAG: hypothetical protein ACYC4R_15105 [Anaerolineae bacterium]